MKVTLVNYTAEARELLLFTKQTRLSMDAGLMEEIRSWPEEKKQKELAYMLGTIQSSWEFVDYVFSIEGVSRAFTHQFVRTRTGDIGGDDEVYIGPRHAKLGSYAQQSQRTVDMSGFEYVTGPAIEKDAMAVDRYKWAMVQIGREYERLIQLRAPPQDARGILPTNICTSIMAKFDLRTISEMAKLRLCSRTQGEYQDVFRAMRLAILNVHPWASPFIRVHCAATGVCCFPNYAECPIKPGIFNPDTGKVWGPETIDNGQTITLVLPKTKEEIQSAWEGMKFEATPRQEPK